MLQGKCKDWTLKERTREGKYRPTKQYCPQLTDDLKEIQIAQKLIEVTRIGAGLGREEEKQMISFLKNNKDKDKRQEAKGSKRGNQEIIGSLFHLRSTLPNLAGQCSDGPKFQWAIMHVYRLYKPKQSLSKGLLTSP
ncbi:hypothetical protein CR513_21965, partial [Mucuna pruriens]